MDILITHTMATTTTIPLADTTVTDHLFHLVSLVAILTTTNSTTADLEVREDILSTIEISAQFGSRAEKSTS